MSSVTGIELYRGYSHSIDLYITGTGLFARSGMLTFSLTLIRHGETQYNRDKLLQGQGVDTLLSETGAQQGEAVGHYLKDIPFSTVFVSNLQRAIQTAEFILKTNNHCSGNKMILEPLLRERGFGIAEGRPRECLKNMANAAGKSSREYTPPGGETLDQVKARVRKFLSVLFNQVVEAHGWSGQEPGTEDGDVSDSAPCGFASDGLEGVSVHALVVSHGAYIRVFMKHVLEDLKCSLPKGATTSHVSSPCPNTGITRFIFTVKPSEPAPVLSDARCVFIYRKDHLVNLEAAEQK
uniref:fructose-2,6-bisphosphate 2-phosphatase n=1 Tax=Neogobius melanostomus TaxID=47308 RepID=A0A8C6T909_9GOBI